MVFTRAALGKSFPVHLATPNAHVSARRGRPSGQRASFDGARRFKTCAAASSSTDVYRWPKWNETWRFLADSGLQSVDAVRAQEMVQTGKWVLVDVRPSSAYQKSHAAGALSIPLFDDVNWSNASPMAYLRAAAYLVNGVSPVVPNEAFPATVAKAKEEGKGFIFYCETGGTMTPSTNFMFGKESRSLKACYRALQVDAQCPCAHLDGGLFSWYRGNMSIVGDYDEGNAGRSPNIAQEPELKEDES